MRLAIAALVVAIVAMAAWVRSQSESIHKLEQTLQQIRSKTAEKPTTADLELQAKCSEGARKAFAEMGEPKNPMAGYENHYNSRMNRCFIQINSLNTKVERGRIWTSRDLYDAFERKQYGTYVWHTEKGKKAWEVPPFECWVILPSGEQKECHSDAEFTSLVNVYMEGGRLK